MKPRIVAGEGAPPSPGPLVPDGAVPASLLLGEEAAPPAAAPVPAAEGTAPVAERPVAPVAPTGPIAAPEPAPAMADPVAAEASARQDAKLAPDLNPEPAAPTAATDPAPLPATAVLPEPTSATPKPAAMPHDAALAAAAGEVMPGRWSRRIPADEQKAIASRLDISADDLVRALDGVDRQGGAAPPAAAPLSAPEPSPAPDAAPPPEAAAPPPEPISTGRYDLTRAAADEAMQGRWLHRIPVGEQQALAARFGLGIDEFARALDDVGYRAGEAPRAAAPEPASAPEPAAPRAAIEPQPSADLPAPILNRANGKPFKTAKSAALGAWANLDLRDRGLVPVKVDGGWGLAPKVTPDSVTAAPPAPSPAATTPPSAPLTRAQAKAEALRQFDEAATSPVVVWKGAANAAREAGTKAVEADRAARVAGGGRLYGFGWEGALANTVDEHWRDFPHYRQGWRAAQQWAAENPRPDGDGTVSVTTRTSTGHETRFTLRADADVIRGVRKRMEKLPLSRFQMRPSADVPSVRSRPSKKTGKVSMTGTVLDAPASFFGWLGAEPAPLWANYEQLAAKHPEWFLSPEDAQVWVERVLSEADTAIPNPDVPGHTQIIRRVGDGELVAVDLVKRGGRYAVESAYGLDPNQLAFKEENARQAGLPVKRRTDLGLFQKSRANLPDTDTVRHGEGDGNISDSPADTLRLSPTFERSPDGIAGDLRARLERVGIEDRVALRLVDAIRTRRDRVMEDGEVIPAGTEIPGAAGRYVDRVIEVALASPDRLQTLGHEVIHALRDLGALRPLEWRVLTRAVEDDGLLLARLRRDYAGLNLSDEALTEEAVAEMFGDWLAGRPPSNSFARRAFERIRDFFQALGNALRGYGFTTPEMVFPAIERADVGRRGRVEEAGGREENAFQALPDDARRFARDLDLFLRGELPSKRMLTLGRTPAVLQALGAQDVPLRVSQKVLRKVAVEKHSVHTDTLVLLPELLADPVMVFDSATQPGSLVAVLNATEIGGEPLIAAIHLASGEITFNAVPSVYGQRQSWFERQINDGRLRYVHTENAPAWLRRIGLQLPKWKPVQGRGGGHHVLTQADVVKGERFSVQVPPLRMDGDRPASENMPPEGSGGKPDRNQDMDAVGEHPAAPADGRLNARGLDALADEESAPGRGDVKPDDDGKFSLRPDPIDPRQPGSADARKGLMLRLLESQPIEWAFRAPFDLFGGVNECGEWKPGLHLHGKATLALTSARFSTEGPMAWMNPVLHKARAVGLLSPEAFERNRGKYLHRVYLKHEADMGGLSRWASHMLTRRRRKILGDQFKGRGMFLEVEPSRLFAGVEDSWDGVIDPNRAGPPVGTRVRVLEKHAKSDGEQQPDGALPTVLHRAFALDDQYRAEDYHGYTPQGTWEVRGTHGGKVVLWRGFTKEERTRMGEIVDARYTIAKTYMLMAPDLSTGRFFRDIAANADWSRGVEPPDGIWRDASDYNRYWADESVAWVRVPDTMIPKSRTKRYGALSGRWVRAEIWRDMAELERMNKPIFWDTVMRAWKLNKTARNPVVHMNNIMSNVMFMDLADVRAADLARAARSLVREDAAYQEAVDSGAFGADMVAAEIRRDVLQPLLDEMARNDRDGRGGLEATFGIAGKLADRLFTGLKAGDQAMLKAYQMEDEVFRMALYLRRRERGATAEQAAVEAREHFMDYDIRAPWVNFARRSFLPFIAYTYRAVPVIAKAIAHRPWKLAKYATMAYAVNALSYAFLGRDDDDEDKERRSLREEEQGYTWIGTPRMMRLPVNDRHGNPVFLDTRRWIPAGDVFDLNQGQSAIPIFPFLQPGGPLAIAAELYLNRQAFTGQDIANPLTDTGMDRAEGVGSYLWKAWMPSAAWIPGSWYWDRIGDAINGVREPYTDRPYSLPQAVASSVGIKVKPQDVEAGFTRWALAFRKEEEALKLEARKLARDRDRGAITQAAFESEMAGVMEKRAKAAKRMREVFGR